MQPVAAGLVVPVLLMSADTHSVNHSAYLFLIAGGTPAVADAPPWLVVSAVSRLVIVTPARPPRGLTWKLHLRPAPVRAMLDSEMAALAFVVAHCLPLTAAY